MRITNKETKEVFTNLSYFVYDAHNRYKIFDTLCLSDIECLARSEDGTLYVLDECGNYEYFPNQHYDYIGGI